MAYGIKYKFKFESTNGKTYTVNLLKDGFSGTAVSRPLGKAPVIRMKEGDPFRATSCDLVLECQTDGEFADLYTSDPFKYRIDVYSGNTQVWTGFIATEVYAEPNIAPPYDVSVTATDGLGILKEYIFEASGTKTLARHMNALLANTGLSLPIDWVSKLSEDGDTVQNFLLGAAINLDYMVGKTCYEVLELLLQSLHATITQREGRWLVIRETDFSIYNGGIAAYRTTTASSPTASAVTLSGYKSVGKMGVADMWPVGHTTRRVVPAKRRVTVEAPWEVRNHAYSVQDDAWVPQNAYATFVSVGGGNSYYHLVTQRVGNDLVAGKIAMARGLYRFTKSLAVKVRASGSVVGIVMKYTPDGGSDYYWNGEEWGTTDPSFLRTSVKSLNVETSAASEAAEVEFTIPAHGETTTGVFYLYVLGSCDVFDVDLRPIMNKGYRDELVIDNGARGDGDTVSITGGRMTSDDYSITTPDMYGVWYSGSSPIYLFADTHFDDVDFMSLQALGRALSVALPRIETSGVLDFPSGTVLPPIAILANSVDSIVTSYDWDLYNDELTFHAVTLPAASLSVESETVTVLGNASVPSSSGGVSGGGSSGGGGGSTVSVADAVTGGGEIVKLTIDGTTTSIKNNVAWGASGGALAQNRAKLSVNGTEKTLLLDGFSELPAVSSSDNGKVLKVVSGAWAKGDDSGIDDVTSQQDGTVDIELTNGDVVTIDMNHTHPQYLKFVLCADEAAYNAISPKDSSTLYLIPES